MRQTLNLSTDRFAHLDGAACLRVMQGTLWLTIDGEPDDRVLNPGDRVALPADAHALVQALDAPAHLTVERPDAWWQPIADTWHAATRRVGVSASGRPEALTHHSAQCGGCQ